MPSGCLVSEIAICLRILRDPVHNPQPCEAPLGCFAAVGSLVSWHVYTGRILRCEGPAEVQQVTNMLAINLKT